MDVENSEEIRSKEGSTSKRKRTRSESMQQSPLDSPEKWRSPRSCISEAQNGDVEKESDNKVAPQRKSPRKRLLDHFPQKSKWNPRDSAHMNAVKEALHVSTAPSAILCREEEQKKIFEFCKECIEHEKAGSLYVCGCPGTGKTLSMEKVKENLVGWANKVGFQVPDVLTINCTSLASSAEIFNKILERHGPQNRSNGSRLPLQHLQNLFSKRKQSFSGKMMLIIVDEMDYLITKDRAVLRDLFMLTEFPFSRFILIGIANAIDLAERFLPKLQSPNCKPMVVTFRAYSKDQILKILQQRLMEALAYDAFGPHTLELCARRVAAESGDMRKALSVCRSAIEILEAELRNPKANINVFSAEKLSSAQAKDPASEFHSQKVRSDHMYIAWSKTFKSAVVDTIQSLPQHQQHR
ncbi:cell division control protein 6 homolog B-like isoform X2 [Tasmannia lanceolata]|uniref:cell division control protein 6 homolog B-like isoform X2 n=1 Tax=Tasmannia lanceolata TaxID=3420 RepID=UPI004064A627